MTSFSDLDRALLAYFDGETVEPAPAGLMDRIEAATRARRPRPAWLATLRSVRLPASHVPAPRGVAWTSPLVFLLVLALAVAAAVVGARLLTAPPVVPVVSLRGEFVGGPSLGAGVSAYDTTGIALSDGRVLLVGCGTTAILNLATGERTRLEPVAACHGFASLVTLQDGQILVVGSNASDTSDVVELFDPVNGTFTETGRLLEGRMEARATLLLDRRVLVSGGTLGGPSGGYAIASAEIYDPTTGTFVATGSMSRARAGHTATRLPDGRVLITGGDVEDQSVADAEIWDPGTGEFAATGPMSTPRKGATAIALADGRVLLVGGYGAIAPAGGVVLLTTGDIFDPATETFSPTGSMVVPRHMHVAAPLPDGRVLIASGTTEPGGNGSVWTGVGMTDAEIYDPMSDRFAATDDMTNPRINAIAIPLADGSVLIGGHANPAGGNSPQGSAGPTSEIFE